MRPGSKERRNLSAEEMAKAKLEIKAAGDAGDLTLDVNFQADPSGDQTVKVKAELLAAGHAGETLEATFERTDGEDGTRDAAASDADWFDEVSQ